MRYSRTRVDKAIILAAGKGERLVNGRAYPKPLEPVVGVPLIVRVLRSLERARVTRVAIVIGYKGDVLRAHLEGEPSLASIELTFVENREYEKPNGTSLLRARAFVDGPAFLFMSDHLFSPSLLDAVRAFPLGDDEAVLGIDRDIGRCFDLDDATKVRTDGDRVIAISKTLERYDALDTGVFRITPALLDALADAETPRGVSLSEGVEKLAARGKMRVADVGPARWIDVDTPEAHAEAERLLRAGELDATAPESP
jgi:choline kinase